MKIRAQEISFPPSMAGNHPQRWDNYFARLFSEEKQPLDTFACVAWKELSVTPLYNQLFTSPDTFSDTRDTHPCR